MKGAVNWLFRWLGSYGLCTSILIGLFLLTLLGTLDQVDNGLYRSVKLYFESFYVLEKLGPLRLPLPGGITLMSLLAVNLLVGGFIRIRKTKRTAGILVIHAGIALLLLAGLVKLWKADEGYSRLSHGQDATHYVSYYDWEVTVRELLPATGDKGYLQGDEWHVGQESFVGLDGDETSILRHPDLPFDLHLSHFVPNANVLPKGPRWSSELPVVDGFGVMPMRKNLEEEFNIAALFATVVPKGAERGVSGERAILWAGEYFPFSFARANRLFAVELRHTRYPMPFGLKLEKFTKEEYPRTDIPSKFSSLVNRIDSETQEEFPVHIQMNEPMRHGGLVVFQSGWGPPEAKPGEDLYSVFSIVRNPSDSWPEIACWIIAAGMLLAFGQRLFAYLKKQAQSFAKESKVREAA